MVEKKNIIKISEEELKKIIGESIKENILSFNGKILKEGVYYDDNLNKFVFNFENDNKTDIISLKKVGYKISAFNQCYYYGYQFEDTVDSLIRSSFIKSIKFPDNKITEKDKKTFIVNAINKLDSDISLPSYKIIVYPESMSEINRDMLKYLNRFTAPDVISMEMIKQLPKNIEFDYKRFKIEVLDVMLENGRPRYSEKQKMNVLDNIREMMSSIKNLQYFSIAKDVKKLKYRQYIKNYYIFKNDEDKALFESIQNSNVLVIDDIATSGTTISHLLNSLRSVNDNNKIVIFSLIGKNI